MMGPKVLTPNQSPGSFRTASQLPLLPVFLTECVNQFSSRGGFSFDHILFKMTLGKVSADQEDADDKDQAVQQKSQKYFMTEFKVHAKPPVAVSFKGD